MIRELKRASILLFASLLLVLLANSVLAAEGNASQCGTVNAAFNMTQNLNSNGTCFEINASNIIIDGGGFTLTGNSTGYGISIIGNHSITLKNFAGINNFTNGIYATGSLNSTVYNNTIVAANVGNGYGIYLSGGSNNTNISSNTVTTSGSPGYGILLWPASNNTITSNTITTSGPTGMGILLYSSSNGNALSSNTITTSGSDGYGISIQVSSISNTVTSNTIATSGSSGMGFYLYSSSNSNLFSSNMITTSHATNAYGIYLEKSTGNSFSRDNITASNSNDIRVYLSSIDNTFTNVILSSMINFTSHTLNNV
ncbi:right-handed parallel beta-helix repeat-containing protein, partial [Candidatus Woesearchaeota archaeon]|nr:right-handed parallel beta-helix repeat-containing protein [Candidatus Woesearchaeota archaeon]